ncbi:MAG TPA: tetratricopeptide repeat protein [Tepidisphaeraceae bacterium]|jgi:tetratricopeptide (TPR) repeat protein|nr:tetratricopeptide repeat protein [Tepidisphaeraceae bacterium]
MSVYRRMLARELPCTLRQLFALEPRKLPAKQLDLLIRRGSVGRADVPSLHRLGMSHIAAEQWGAATQYLSSAIEIHPSHIPSRLALAIAYEGLAQHNLAAAQLDAVLALNPITGPVDSDTLLCASGLSWERAGNLRLAMHRYEDALLQRPTNRFASNRLIALHLASGHTTAVALRLSRSLDNRPNDLAARICLGHVLQLAGRHTQAATEYEKALRLEPDAVLPTLEMAQALQLIENGGQAIGLLKKLLTARPECPDLCLKLAELYSQAGHDQQARTHYEKALSLHPEYIECRISFARHELRMGRRQESARQFRRALAIHEQHIELYVGLALAIHRSGQTTQAAEVLRSAARLSRNAGLLICQLRKLHEQNRPLTTALSTDGAPNLLQVPASWIEEQIDEDQRTLVRHPRWNDVRVRLAGMLRLLDRMDEAVELLRRAVLSDTSCGDAWFQLGLNFVDTDNLDRAILAFQSGLVLDGKRADAEYRVGLIYCGELEFDLAMEVAGGLDDDMQRQVWVVLDAMGLCDPPDALPIATPVPATANARA